MFSSKHKISSLFTMPWIPRSASVLYVLAAVSVILAGSSQKVLANTPSGITVSPVQVSLNTGAESGVRQAAITITNNYANAITFDVSIQGLELLANGSLTPNGEPDAGLAEALTITPTLFTVQAGTSQSVQVQLSDTKDLSPGGHYASLLIKQKQAAKEQLTLTPAISVVLFVVKEDGAIRSVDVGTIDADGGIFRLPSVVTVDFINKGNVTIIPRASIMVLTNRGTIVATGALNTQSFSVWPDKTLKIQTSLTKIASILLPGRYTVQILYRYDGSDEQRSITLQRWFVPPALLLAVSIGIMLLVLLRTARLKHFLYKKSQYLQTRLLQDFKPAKSARTAVANIRKSTPKLPRK